MSERVVVVLMRARMWGRAEKIAGVQVCRWKQEQFGELENRRREEERIRDQTQEVERRKPTGASVDGGERQKSIYLRRLCWWYSGLSADWSVLRTHDSLVAQIGR